MGGCQNYGPFLGSLNIRCRIIIGIQIFHNHPNNYQYCGSMFLVLGFLVLRVWGLGGLNLTVHDQVRLGFKI